MSTIFPSGIDTFINPVYRKVDGIDYIKASHINDLQDAVRQIQLLIVGLGNPVWINGAEESPIIPTNSSVQNALELLDQYSRSFRSDYDLHLDRVSKTDPSAHHAEVIDFTPIQYLNENRVQQAIAKLQGDIVKILTGAELTGLGSLDERYILANQDTTVHGSMTIEGGFDVLGDVIFGRSLANLVDIAGALNVKGTADLEGDATFGGSISMKESETFFLVDSEGAPTGTALSFGSDGIEIKSKNNVIIRLDKDSLINPNNSSFKILNDSDVAVFTADEGGNVTAVGKVISKDISVADGLYIGASKDISIERTEQRINAGNYTVKVDYANAGEGAYYAITKDGASGEQDYSPQILLKAKEDAIISGTHILKQGGTEKGVFGFKSYCPNAGGNFYGFAVNFKSTMKDVPASLILTTENSANIKSIRQTALNKYGAFIEVEPENVGSFEIFGTYTVVSGG